MDVKDAIVDTYLKERMNDYMKYKKMLSSEKKITLENRDYDSKGWVTLYTYYLFIEIFFKYVDLEKDVTLKYLRIFFEAEPYDKITKDSSAKFTDILAAIGGTMGLLTGFSIISGIEILYFGFKIILNLVKGKPVKKRNHFNPRRI